jgi:large subunit ribosomal protein L32e
MYKMVEDKLQVRKATKKRKPTYKRVQSNQYAKFRDVKWRRPKGKGNKDRKNRKGHIGMVQVGYGSPKEVRGLNKDGLQEVIVFNIEGLKTVTKGQAAVIARTVGAKKRLTILEEAKKSKIAIANVKDIDAKIKELTKTPNKTAKKVADKKEESKKEAPKKETPKKEESKKETPKKTPTKKGGANK